MKVEIDMRIGVGWSEHPIHQCLTNLIFILILILTTTAMS